MENQNNVITKREVPQHSIFMWISHISILVVPLVVCVLS
jgi:hypothetical protein